MLIRLLIALLALAVGIGAHKQTILADKLHNETVSNDLPVLPESLASLRSIDSFTTLSHARFPHHAVRIKRSDFCDPTVS
jgi:hypothetical protein